MGGAGASALASGSGGPIPGRGRSREPRPCLGCGGVSQASRIENDYRPVRGKDPEIGAGRRDNFNYNRSKLKLPRNHGRIDIVTSGRKAEANRQNALKSTGPKTPEGKAAVRLNALTHGLRSGEVLLPGEDGEAFSELGERLRAELQPVGELENLLADRIISAY